MQRFRSLSRSGSAFRHPRSPRFQDRRVSQEGEVTVSKGVNATVVKGGKVVVGERTVREEARGERVRDTSAESWKMRTIWSILGRY